MARFFDSMPQGLKEKTEKEGTYRKMISVFLDITLDLNESGELDQILNENFDDRSNEGVSGPVFMTDTGKI